MKSIGLPEEGSPILNRNKSTLKRHVSNILPDSQNHFYGNDVGQYIKYEYNIPPPYFIYVEGVLA